MNNTRIFEEFSDRFIIFLKKGMHFWYPQLAIWLEDTAGKYIKTIFITNSTAKGLFYTSRTKDNYKLHDGKNFEGGVATRRLLIGMITINTI